jgi:phosphoribosylanthranilate isomerase
VTSPEPGSNRQRTHVKICGLRDSPNALVAADAGADYLAFNFVEGVRRQLQPDEGQWVTEGFIGGREGIPNGPKLVGLFRDQPVEWVRRVSQQCHLHMAQLNGDEDLAYAEELIVPVMRQIRVKPDDAAEDIRKEVESWLSAGHMVILDSFHPSAPGGTGVAFDWSVADGIVEEEGVLLAGGLTPENVGAATQQLNPWGVDVASGVEVDGVKDPDKIREFINAARSA